MTDRIRTSISLNREAWKEFQLWVFIRDGNRKASFHVENALREYMEKYNNSEETKNVE